MTRTVPLGLSPEECDLVQQSFARLAAESSLRVAACVRRRRTGTEKSLDLADLTAMEGTRSAPVPPPDVCFFILSEERRFFIVGKTDAGASVLDPALGDVLTEHFRRGEFAAGLLAAADIIRSRLPRKE